MAALGLYEVTLAGGTTATLHLSDEDAQAYGAKARRIDQPADTATAAPAGKARTPQNKARTADNK